ncbi:MAG: HAMP domain-containing histidine kinase [bacterium]|nr:HAMP domain-containing histidine kinase [bacterium]
MPQDSRIPPETSQFVSAASLRVRLDWFNKLRWIAAGAVVAAILVVGVVGGYPLPVVPMSVATVVLLLLNVFYVWRNRRIPPENVGTELRLVKLQMAGDLLVLTKLVNLTGGVENPLLFIYVLHVVIASLLFKGRDIFAVAWFAILLFTGTVALEFFEVVPHHHLLSASDMTHELPYILTTLASFWLVLLASAWMGATIMDHNRSIKDELVARQQELIKADQAKTDFFRFVTHEVKSPVSTAQSAVETALELGGSSMDPSSVDLLSRAVGRLEQATDMVKDLADLTRGGILTRDALRPVDVREMVGLAVEHQRELAERREQTIDFALPETPVVMTTSRSMVEKIAANLVSNAVRYNRKGGTVTVVLEDREDRVVLIVRDEGIGIDPADQERIFDEFYRAPAAQKLTNLGTGLGLPIVRRFVTNLRGTIQVTSGPDEGAEFRVVLPRQTPPLGDEPGADGSTTS